MKKFTKISMILAGIFAAVGLICLIGSFALGLTFGTFAEMVSDGKFSFGIGNMSFGIGNHGFGLGVVSTDSKEQEVSADKCENLEIELGAGSLELVYDDVDKIEIRQNGVSGFKSKMDGDTLKIEGGLKVGINSNGGTITITIPKGMRFDEVDLEVGAGEAYIGKLTTNLLDVEVGAGEADIRDLDTVTLNAGVGAGKLYMELVGSENDYNYDVECGIGEILIGDNSYGGLGKNQSVSNTGAKRMLDVECGIGEVEISFIK